MLISSFLGPLNQENIYCRKSIVLSVKEQIKLYFKRHRRNNGRNQELKGAIISTKLRVFAELLDKPCNPLGITPTPLGFRASQIGNHSHT
jgi:hypothetical protein